MKEKKLQIFKRNRVVAFSLAAILCVGMGSVGASAEEPAEESSDISYSYIASEIEVRERTFETEDIEYTKQRENFKSLSKITNKNISAYSRKNIRLNNKNISVGGFRINGIDYIPFRAVANALGASYSYNSSNGNSVMRSSGLVISATSGNYVIYANDRPLFSTSPTVIMSDGRMYIPATAFAKACGMKLSASTSSILFSGAYSPLKNAASYYREDEVFWLARIIHAEARGEPLLGEIAVGNVVLNRVKSGNYPNTIYGVIFDKKYGVQFSPVLDGSIYNTPSYNSVLAAKICLEGVDVSEGALFFLRPETSSSSWIPNSRPYLFSIGKHDFYK